MNVCLGEHTCQPSRSRRDSPDLETKTRRPARRPKKPDSSRFIPNNAQKHELKPAFCLFSLFFSRNSSFFCFFWLFFMYPSVAGSDPNKKICIYSGIRPLLLFSLFRVTRARSFFRNSKKKKTVVSKSTELAIESLPSGVGCTRSSVGDRRTGHIRTMSCRSTLSRMSRGGCCGMTNADWLISPPAAQILPSLLRERVRMEKIKETERVRIPYLPAFFL